MFTLLSNIRFYILLGAVLTAQITAVILSLITSDARLATIRIQEVYSFLSTALLYIALLITPLAGTIKLPYVNQIFNARRAIGVSAFGFGFLHAALAFYGQFGGFSALPYLDNQYISAFIYGVIALVILGAMAFTSFDWVIEKMTFKWWKRLHRLVYIAGLSILIHIYTIGSHFNDITSVQSIIFLSALIFLATLWAIGLDRRTTIRFGSFGPYMMTLSVGLALFSVSLLVARLIEADIITPLYSSHEESS